MPESVSWLIVFVMLYWAFCFFWGIRALRRAHTASDFFIYSRNLSPWVFALAATGVCFGGWAFIGHPGLIFRDGFQYVNASFFAIAVPLAGVVLLKRQWILGQRFGYMTAGEMFADYFGGHGLRLISVGIALLFGVPFVGIFFSASGFLVSHLSGGLITHDYAMWALSAFVLFYAVTGGMQAVAKIAVVQCVLFLIGAVALGFYALDTVGGFDALNTGLAKMALNVPGLWGTTNGAGGGNYSGFFAIPGVIQFTAGLGVEAPDGGPWTAVMVLSFMMAAMGLQASPSFSMWGFASKSPRGFAIQQVWGGAACAGAIMLIFATIIGVSAHLLGANADVNEAGFGVSTALPVLSDGQQNQLVANYILLIGERFPWLLGFLAVCAIAALQVTGAAFLFTAGGIVTRDIFVRYVQPDADDRRQMLAGRICTGLVFLAGMLLATYSTDSMVIFAGLALACAFQLWPTLLAVTWFPWITRQAATLGLIAGLIAVGMTELLGQKVTGQALPWGRWPWTIHSAAWGMFFNVIVCLLVSALTRLDPARAHREGFHAVVKEFAAPVIRRRWSSAVAAIIVMVWLFFAVGPGSVIGNFLFGEPLGDYAAWHLGMPSIWAWQIIWWALGVGMIWYLADRMEMSTAPQKDVTKFSDGSGR